MGVGERGGPPRGRPHRLLEPRQSSRPVDGRAMGNHPFGGVKESGLGRGGGRVGIAEFLEYKLITMPMRR
jgi:hypothetical protein